MENRSETPLNELDKNNQVGPKKKNKNRKKRSGGDGDHEGSSSTAEGIVAALKTVNQKMSNKKIKQTMEIFNQEQKPTKTTEALHKSHQFWSTQSVPKLDENIVSNEPIEPPEWKLVLKTEPYTLPDGFKWDTLNLNDPLILRELYTLLNENYCELECPFRYEYQMDYLLWALQPPDCNPDFHCGVRVVKSGKLVAFISANPARLKVYDQEELAVTISFLCVHRKLRAKRVAPVLIKEITRRVKLTGVYLAAYTVDMILPKPIATCKYWHRSLNPKKLIEVKFSQLSRNMTMQRTIKLLKLPDSPKTPGLRKLEPRDCEKVHKLLNDYLSKFDLRPIFDEKSFKHWFMPQSGIITSFVVEAADGAITDFISYYTLNFAVVVPHTVHKFINVAYALYNVSTKTPWVDLMNDALITARNSGFDVFFALDLMENKEFLEPLKFCLGHGNMHFYLYNWRCPSMTPNKIGLVLQ